MNGKPNLFDMLDRLAGDVAGRTSELKAEKERLKKVLEEAETASERLKQIDALLQVAEASGRIGAVRPTASPSGSSGGSLPQRVRAVLTEAEEPLSSGQIIDRLGLKDNKSLKMQVYSAINRLAKAGELAVDDASPDGKRTYKVASKKDGGDA